MRISRTRIEATLGLIQADLFLNFILVVLLLIGDDGLIPGPVAKAARDSGRGDPPDVILTIEPTGRLRVRDPFGNDGPILSLAQLVRSPIRIPDDRPPVVVILHPPNLPSGDLHEVMGALQECWPTCRMHLRLQSE